MADIPSWAKPNVELVCVDVDFAGWQSPLVLNCIYTLERVLPNTRDSEGPHAGAKILAVLSGLQNPYDMFDGAFALDRFKPLISQPSKEELQARKELFDGWLKTTPADNSVTARLDALAARGL